MDLVLEAAREARERPPTRRTRTKWRALRGVLNASLQVCAVQRPESPGRIIERFVRAAAFEVVPAIVDEVLRSLAHSPVAPPFPARSPIRGAQGDPR